MNLNVSKTKAIVFDFRKSRPTIPQLAIIASEYVERVSEYKYLGIIIDDKLTGSQNTQMVYKKCTQRVPHLRIVYNLEVSPVIVSLLYKSIIESVLSYSIAVWYGRLSTRDRNKLNKIIKTSQRLGARVTSLEDLFNKFALIQVKKIMSNKNHPLYDMYTFLRSGRRLALPSIRTTRYKNSFVPKSIKLYNLFY